MASLASFFSRKPGPAAPDARHAATTAVRWFIVTTLGALGVLTYLVKRSGGAAVPYSSDLVIVAVGFLGLGAVLGFLYSTFGDEETRFSPVMTAITTGLGGAGLADATNPAGLTRQIYRELACAACLGGCSRGLLLALAAIFLPLGFFILYFSRRLLLNGLQREMDANAIRLNELSRSSLAPASEIELDATPGSAVFRTDPTARANATDWLARERSEEPGYDDLLADARAQIALEKYPEAVVTLGVALQMRPTSGAAALLLAAADVAQEKFIEAVETLERLISQNSGQTPANAWKLLGYARLYLTPPTADRTANLWRAVSASGAYLNLVPSDLGGLLNRACAYGQLGPGVPKARAGLMEDLARLFASAPDARENVRALTVDGEDFAAWKDDAEFKALLDAPDPSATGGAQET